MHNSSQIFFNIEQKKKHAVPNKKIPGNPFLRVKTELRLMLNLCKFEGKDKSDNSSQSYLCCVIFNTVQEKRKEFPTKNSQADLSFGLRQS